jgi:hypothetical protein
MQKFLGLRGVNVHRADQQQWPGGAGGLENASQQCLSALITVGAVIAKVQARPMMICQNMVDLCFVIAKGYDQVEVELNGQFCKDWDSRLFVVAIVENHYALV